jgi:TRAP-type C4-dicarboxylate transport system permease small subunit
MGLVKIVAIVLILAGSFGLVYGGFSYTKDTQEAKIGPLELSVKETKTVNIPIWVGVVAIAIGSGLLLFSSKRS